MLVVHVPISATVTRFGTLKCINVWPSAPLHISPTRIPTSVFFNAIQNLESLLINQFESAWPDAQQASLLTPLFRSATQLALTINTQIPQQINVFLSVQTSTLVTQQLYLVVKSVMVSSLQIRQRIFAWRIAPLNSENLQLVIFVWVTASPDSFTML